MTKKQFTYNVSVSFEMQFTFSESEVEQSDEGDEGDMSPTDAALEELGKEIADRLGEHFGGVKKVAAWAGFDELLGVEED